MAIALYAYATQSLAHAPKTTIHYCDLETLEQYKYVLGLSKNKPSPANLCSSVPAPLQTLLWHQYIPTTGLRLIPRYFPPCYPYLPHYFSLWDLAPHKGAGIRVALIDTGIAAFSFEHDTAHRKHKDLHMMIEPGNYCVVGKYGNDNCFEQLKHGVQNYCSSGNEEELERELPSMISEFLQNKTTLRLKDYLTRYGNAEVDAGSALTTITTGKQGIAPITRPSLFSIKKLMPSGEMVVANLLPTVEISTKASTFIAGHGSHLAGLIAGQQQAADLLYDTGIVGLAPQAHLIMIKAFDEWGASDKKSLLAALKKASFFKADIVNLSLKITDALDLTDQSSQALENTLASFPYVVVAAGNAEHGSANFFHKAREGYPARFKGITFDVGAFDYQQESCPIAPFSQYERGIGPKIVAPGCNIMSAGLVPDQRVDSMYVCLQGTSMASAQVTGFLALFLGEFKNYFSSDQIVKICTTSTIKMHATSDWQEKTVFGVIDMRTALFKGHVLRKVKDRCKDTFDWYFDKLLVAVDRVLHTAVNAHAQRYLINTSFKIAYMDYYKQAYLHKHQYKVQDYYVHPITQDTAIDFVTDQVTHDGFCRAK